MDSFFDLFTITSNTPEDEAPSAPVDAGGTGGCIVA
jgi:hypothetical protein